MVDLVPPSVLEMVKTHGLVIEVGESKDYPLYPKWVEDTKKYSRTYKLENNLIDYVSGTPFPDIDMKDPQAGLKIGWNSQYHSQAEQRVIGYPWTPSGSFIWINKDRIERIVESTDIVMCYVGRTQDPPIPEIPNKEGIIFKEMNVFTNPQDVAGIGFFRIRYKSVTKDDDTWLYAPSLRRVRRVAGGQKTDSLIGSLMTIEDFWGFSGKITDFDWKLLGKKKMLFIRDTEKMPIDFGGTRYKWNPVNVKWQMRDVYIVEHTPKIKGHPYSKRILYYDAQWMDNLCSEIFDRGGKLWKMWLNPWYWNKDSHTFMWAGNTILDFQALYATNSKAANFPNFRALKPEQLTIELLEKWGR